MVIARFVYSQTAISFGNLWKARQGKGIELGRIGTGIRPAIIIDGTFSGLRSRFFLNVDILIRDQYYYYNGHCYSQPAVYLLAAESGVWE